jgi:hypothetical protein
MQRLFTFILFFMTIHLTYSSEGVVLVPQTALYLEESEKAEISEYRLKGELLFIHGYYNTKSDHLNFENTDFKQIKFYKSIDRIGRPVYVKAEDVFIYYGDTREIEQLE